MMEMRKANLILKVVVTVSILAGGGNIVVSLPYCATISGTVTLQGWTNHTCPVTFQLRNPGETIVLEAYPKVTGQDGSYTIDDVPAGTYDLAVYKVSYPRNYLWEIQQVVVQEGTPCTANFELKGGDCNSTNSVNILDLNILKATYGKSEGQEGYDERADFNRSGSVNIQDLNILKSNYGKSGAQPGVPDPTAPVVTITSPAPPPPPDWETVSGDVTVTTTASDTQGDYPWVVSIDLYADGELIHNITQSEPQPVWQSYVAPNGHHILQAFAIDGDAKTGWSEVIDVNSDNFVSNAYVNDEVGIGNPIPITANLEQSSPYTVEIKRYENVIWTHNEINPVSTVNVPWDPSMADAGLHECTITPQTGGGGGSSAALPSAVTLGFVVTKSNVKDAVVVILAPDLLLNQASVGTIRAVEEAAKGRNLSYVTLATHRATWANLSSALKDGACRHLYVVAHGNRCVPQPPQGQDEPPPGAVMRTVFQIYGDSVVSFREGLPEAWINKVRAIGDLGLQYRDDIRIAYMDFCYSGYIQYDMARALGIYSSWTQGYLGWYGWKEASV
jgi:hypothetical protein